MDLNLLFSQYYDIATTKRLKYWGIFGSNSFHAGTLVATIKH